LSTSVEEDALVSQPKKSNSVYSGTVSTNNSSDDVLEGVIVVKPSKRRLDPKKVNASKSTKPFSNVSHDFNLGKRYAAFLSLAYLSSKCLEINQEHAQNEVLISLHFDESQRRLQKIQDRLSSHPQDKK
jgi:hypothetical protein